MGTEQLPEAILALMQSQNILWPEGTPIAGTPLLRSVRLSVDGVSVQPTNGAQVFSDFIGKLAGPVQVARPSVTLEIGRKEYLEHKKGERLSEGWRENIERQIGKFIAWAADQGATTFEAVTAQITSRYRTYLRTELKVGDDSVKQKLSILSSWFAWAVKPCDWIAENPVEGLIEAVDRPDVIVYQPDEALAIMEAARERGAKWAAVTALALYGGLRREEAVTRLYWEDLDKAEGMIRVRDQAGQRTKTRRSRTVPLFDEILGPLDRLGWKDAGRIFEDWNDLRDVSRGVGNACEAAGVRKGERDGLQYLRHTAASCWVKLGVPAVDAKRWLGHREDQMTFERHYCGRLARALPVSWKGSLIGRTHVPPI
jgi:integrase